MNLGKILVFNRIIFILIRLERKMEMFSEEKLSVVFLRLSGQCHLLGETYGKNQCCFSFFEKLFFLKRGSFCTNVKTKKNLFERICKICSVSVILGILRIAEKTA